ncbi:MAG: LUD domain-containing protein [Opitutaceae bacterium]|jgi:L-lactate dehydrogenase complex protein LldG|nr:LUD domain-containing protein [Opitutaceae bacterium]
MSSDRDSILSRVRSALAPLPERAALPDWERELVIMRNARGAVDAVALFSERLVLVNGTPLTSAADLVALLEKNGWRRGYCDPALWPGLQAAFPATFTVETLFDRSRVDDYQFGITAAAGGIAETGTVILTDGGTSRRLAALAPWVHVAVLSRRTIFVDVPEAVAALGSDPNIIWCTGPSKTADVEGILIEGVHGPGIQVALLVD